MQCESRADMFMNAIDVLLQEETIRAQKQINLIASENYAPAKVRDIVGSLLMDKYAEGYPGKRYYAGCSVIDKIEQVAIDACSNVFDPECTMHVNVQPHSGSAANMAVYMALAKPGDCILGMHMSSGGHLTHGNIGSFSSHYYKAVTYNVDNTTGLIDYDALKALSQAHQPKIIVAGASAYSRFIDYKIVSQIAQEINALLVVDIAHVAGLIAAGLHPSPVGYADCITSTTHKTLRGPRGGFILCKKEYATAIDKAVMPGIQGGPFMNSIAAKAVCFMNAQTDEFKEYQKNVVANAVVMAQEFSNRNYRIISGGTDTHLFVIDLSNKNVTGRAAEKLLEQMGILVSRSTIPADTQKPFTGSGIRVGTAAITTRGMGKEECIEIVAIIDQVIQNTLNMSEKNKNELLLRVEKLTQKFPIT